MTSQSHGLPPKDDTPVSEIDVQGGPAGPPSAEWVPDDTYKHTDINDPKWNIVPSNDVNTSASNWGIFGDRKWFGPGTDIEYNLRNKVQPVDEIDDAGREHDLAYYDIRQAYNYGELSEEAAAAAVAKADLRLAQRLEKAPGGAFWSGGWAGKRAIDWFVGPTFAGLNPEEHGRYRRPSSDSYWRGLEWEPGMEWVDTSEGHAGGYYAWPEGYGYREQPTVDLRPYDPRQGSDPWSGGGPGTPGWGMPPPSSSSVPPLAVIDVNNNGIPDVYERKPKKRYRRRRIYV